MSEGKKPECEWCKHNPYGCAEDETCDFKSLGNSKEEIVARVKFEVHAITDMKEDVLNGRTNDAEKLFADIMDKITGVQIMVDRLKSEFEMSDEEIKKQANFDKSKLSMKDKTKLAFKLAKMKAKRKSKKSKKQNDEEESK